MRPCLTRLIISNPHLTFTHHHNPPSTYKTHTYTYKHTNRWFTKRLDIVLKRNPKVRQVLASVFRRCWFVRFQIKARNGVKQIKRFIKDCSGSDKVKKVYFYRAKIIRIQRWFREWFSIQEVSLSLSLRLKGVFLYTVGILFNVEWCFRQL